MIYLKCNSGHQRDVFLVAAFSFKERSPTITVTSFFVRQQNECLVHTFYKTTKLLDVKRYIQNFHVISVVISYIRGNSIRKGADLEKQNCSFDVHLEVMGKLNSSSNLCFAEDEAYDQKSVRIYFSTLYPNF